MRPGRLGGGQRIDHIYGCCKQNRVTFQAGAIAHGRCQMGLTEANTAKEDYI